MVVTISLTSYSLWLSLKRKRRIPTFLINSILLKSYCSVKTLNVNTEFMQQSGSKDGIMPYFSKFEFSELWSDWVKLERNIWECDWLLHNFVWFTLIAICESLSNFTFASSGAPVFLLFAFLLPGSRYRKQVWLKLIDSLALLNIILFHVVYLQLN